MIGRPSAAWTQDTSLPCQRYTWPWARTATSSMGAPPCLDDDFVFGALVRVVQAAVATRVGRDHLADRVAVLLEQLAPAGSDGLVDVDDRPLVPVADRPAVGRVVGG